MMAYESENIAMLNIKGIRNKRRIDAISSFNNNNNNNNNSKGIKDHYEYAF